ncbi:hypothetical protein pb186bvf_012556 [Paramecium bursaria]
MSEQKQPEQAPSQKQFLRELKVPDQEYESKLEAEESLSEGQQPTNSGQHDSFLNFVRAYTNYYENLENPVLDMQKVLTRLNDQIVSQKPPSQNQELQEFHSKLEIKENEILSIQQELKQSPDSKMLELIEKVEKYLQYQILQDQQKDQKLIMLRRWKEVKDQDQLIEILQLSLIYDFSLFLILQLYSIFINQLTTLLGTINFIIMKKTTKIILDSSVNNVFTYMFQPDDWVDCITKIQPILEQQLQL